MITLLSIENTEEILLTPGSYFIQLWGAQGGTGMSDGILLQAGGKGAYASGYLSLRKETKLFANIGSKGKNGNKQSNTIASGGWNGGGAGGKDLNDNDGSAGGGGATDLRIGENILENRIMVAAGGSGSAATTYGAPGGDTMCYKIIQNDDPDAYEGSTEGCGDLGKGEDGKSDTYTPSSGAGGGFYGGRAVSGGSVTYGPRASFSGSSFVAGYHDQDSLDEILTKAEASITLPVILAGFEVFPAPGGGVERGHEGSGFIRITPAIPRLPKLFYATPVVSLLVGINPQYFLINDYF